EHAPPGAEVEPADRRRGSAPERAAVPRDLGRDDLDEAAEWARIVSAFEAEAEHGSPGVTEQPSYAPPPPPHEAAILDRPDEHFEPPPPPPIPAPAPASLYAVLLVAAGLLLFATPGVLGLSSDVGLVLGVAALAGGAFLLVSRMRDRSPDDDDDGAVV
ncbi:MAG TPA: hypothetical protein VM097_01335, partial [Mycobacteriales bacterium]|nr:hypothetical protein [Mycobacteriales bacterium]